MDSKLQKQLFEEFPKLFKHFTKEYDEDDTLPPAAFGIECADGWYDIIYSLCNRIQTHVEQQDFDVHIEQIKEKFGGLRVYTDGADKYIHGMITMSESFSYLVCEKCGSTDDVEQTKGYIRTLCGECRNDAK